MVQIIDSVSGSPNIPAKVQGKKFLQYWYAEMEKNPFLRDIFEPMTEEEMAKMYGPDMEPNSGDEGGNSEAKGEQKQGETPEEAQGKEQPKQEVEQIVKQNPEGMSKEEEVIRNSFQ